MELRQVFIEGSIFHYFDPDCHIRNETDVSSYTINRVLSQLISNIFER